MDEQTRILREKLNDVQQLPEVLLLKKTTQSTNDDVRELVGTGVSSVLICSEQQTNGRGQHERPWISPQGNIYLSALIHTTHPLDGRLALEVALNILQMPSLKDLPELSIKWPNDLYSPLGKWGGILIEPIDLNCAIVGIGINLHPVSDAQIDQAATDLLSLNNGVEVDRISLIAEIYQAILQATEWFNHGCYNLAARFNHFAAFKDQPIEFEQINQTIHGIFKGIRDDGSLLIKSDQGTQPYYQGRLKVPSSVK